MRRFRKYLFACMALLCATLLIAVPPAVADDIDTNDVLAAEVVEDRAPEAEFVLNASTNEADEVVAGDTVAEEPATTDVSADAEESATSDNADAAADVITSEQAVPAAPEDGANAPDAPEATDLAATDAAEPGEAEAAPAASDGVTTPAEADAAKPEEAEALAEEEVSEPLATSGVNRVLQLDDAYISGELEFNGFTSYTRDVYRVTLPKDGKLKVTGQARSVGYIRWLIMSPDESILYKTKNTGQSSKATEQSPITATNEVYLQKGDYIIVVYPVWEVPQGGMGNKPGGTYRIKASFEEVLVSGLSYGTADKEPDNDNFAGARTVYHYSPFAGLLYERGAYVSGTDRGPDVDFYKFVLPSKQKVNFGITAYDNSLKFSLYNSEHSVVETYEGTDIHRVAIPLSEHIVQASGGSSSSYVAELNAGTYYIKIAGWGNQYSNRGTRYDVIWRGANMTSSIKVTGPASLVVGKTGTAKATVNPSTASKSMTWKSSNTAIATVDANGKLTAKKAGTATITATAKDGTNRSGSYTLKVTNPVKVTSVKVTGAATMNPGQSQTLKLTVAPSNATDKAVSWKSSNTGVATVDANGKVTAKKPGTTTITATAKDGSKKAGSFKVTVRTPSISYRTHVQMIGWQNYVKDGAMSGTSGKAYRLEGINIKLANVNGGIEYRTHVQNIGWQGWKKNGEMSGTSGRALRLEGIRIRLTGEIAKYYDVYYRVHCQNIGWMGWAKNGQDAGSAGYAYRLEGIQIVLVPKGGAAPAATYKNIKANTNQAFRQK